MRYFLDTEFIEGFTKPLFGRPRHFIDLISIGIVAEDGRKYYAISNEFNPADANDWVKENVLYPLMVENGYSKNLSNLHGCLSYSYSAVRRVQAIYGKSNKQIATEICAFINHGLDDIIYKITRADCWHESYYPGEFAYIKSHNTFIPDYIYKSGDNGTEKNKRIIYNQPEFYGYFADYAWVLLCSLYGRMIDLPKGFPKYCRDLKQMLDEKVENTCRHSKEEFKDALKRWQEFPTYPKQFNEHNALADARWNKALFEFIEDSFNHAAG